MGFPAAHAGRFRRAFEGRTVCITGGAGFIGGHLAAALLDLGANLSVIDDLSGGGGARIERLIDDHPGRVRYVLGSILDPRALAEAVEGTSIVFHLAAVVSVPRSVHDPLRTLAVNDTGTARVAEACRAASVERWVYAASSSAYGDEPALPKVESMTPVPRSPYAASKLAGEHIVRAWRRSYGLPGISLRFFNVFGPHQPAEGPYASVIAAFSASVHAGRPPVIFGDGSNSRDFTPVADAVQALLLAAGADQPPDGEAVNVGHGRRTTIADLAAMIARLAGRPELTPRFEPPRAGDVAHSQADLTLARRLLGYEPAADFEAALRETVEWHARGGRITVP